MIYFTHSYHKQKLGQELFENDFIDGGIYINKISSVAKNPTKTIDNYKIPVIYDSPLYVSNFVDQKEPGVIDQISKRGLSSELLDSSKIIDYITEPDLFVHDVKKCWENYLKNIPSKSAELVLSLPAIDELALSSWDKLLNIIPKADFKWISVGIHHSDLDSIDKNNFVKKINEICKKIGSNKLLFTILTNEENTIYSERDLQTINNILKNLQISIHVVVHHADTLCFQSSEIKNIAIGLHNQTKNLSSTQVPFIIINGQMRPKATSFISADLLSDLHKKRFFAGHKLLEAHGNEAALKITEPIYQLATKYFNENEKDEWASMKMSAVEIKKIINMTIDEKINAKHNVDQLFYDTPIKKKETLYKIDGSKIKIL